MNRKKKASPKSPDNLFKEGLAFVNANPMFRELAYKASFSPRDDLRGYPEES
jgi:hypothetical protein